MQQKVLSVAVFLLTLKFSSSQFQFPLFPNQMNFPNFAQQSNFNQQSNLPQQSQGNRINPNQNIVFPSQFGPSPNTFAFPNYYPQNQFGQQVQTPSTTQRTTRRPSIPQQNNLRGISQRKCDEYSKLIKRKVHVASLSLEPATQDITYTECETVTGLVVGGEDAKPFEFPHMAAIGYPNFDGVLSFSCGGSLISEQFVLTAAHCSKADRVSPTMVRLGDLNLKRKEVALAELDVPIKKFISHESYNSETRENDIALIKMEQPVTFSKSVRPACLQQNDFLSKSNAIAIGWGYLEVGGLTSDTLQKVRLDIIDNQKCSQVYNDEDNYHIYNSQICAGVLKGGKDTCGGDSGGPLQNTINGECVFSIIGVTSYGSTYCGSKNSPGIYTRVSSHLPWIEQTVWG